MPTRYSPDRHRKGEINSPTIRESGNTLLLSKLVTETRKILIQNPRVQFPSYAHVSMNLEVEE